MHRVPDPRPEFLPTELAFWTRDMYWGLIVRSIVAPVGWFSMEHASHWVRFKIWKSKVIYVATDFSFDLFENLTS